MIQKIKSPKFQNILICTEGILVSILALLAIHNTVTATGAGYLLFLKTGVLSRTGWDITVDAFVFILSLALVLIPVLIRKAGIKDAFLFLMAVISLCALVRPDILLTSFMGREGLEAGKALFDLLTYLPTLSVALLLTAGIIFVFNLGDEGVKKHFVGGVFAVLFLLLSVLITSFYEIFLFAAGYTVLLPMIGRVSKIKYGTGLLSVVLFAASVWKLYFVLITY